MACCQRPLVLCRHLPSSSGISSLRLATDRGKEKRLLPFGRLARSIKPRIGGLARTSKGGNDLGGGKLGKRFGEGHGQTIPEKEKSAMQKINLDKCPQCRQSQRMSNTLQQHGFKGDEVANVVFRKNDIQTNQFFGFVVEVEGQSIASGFNTEGKAKEWAKRKGVPVA